MFGRVLNCTPNHPIPCDVDERKKPLDAYCMKCKQTRTMQNPTEVTMKNGRPATQGTCPTCGTKMFKIGSGAAKK